MPLEGKDVPPAMNGGDTDVGTKNADCKKALKASEQIDDDPGGRNVEEGEDQRHGRNKADARFTGQEIYPDHSPPRVPIRQRVKSKELND
jgi:hypothetical protein